MTRDTHRRKNIHKMRERDKRCQKARNKALSSKETGKMPKTKRTQNTHVNKQKDPALGIPVVLRRICLEKNTVVVPVKLPPTLAEYVRRQGGSAWIRQTIIKKLEKGG